MVLLKSSASRQEKASHCNETGAATDEHFRDGLAAACCRDMNTARPK
ncbi:MAG: hypothetical protein JWP98_1073, partial [Edaphobacter sp.]|nr:hypothetical protein [Edaphobacter sp.]